MRVLEGQIVLITGASSGFGEATAKAFAREGARLILAARREDRLKSLSDELRGWHGTESYVLVLDVRDTSMVEAAFASLPDNWRDVEILVNNAGLARGMGKLHEGNFDDWNEMIDANIKGLLSVSRAIIPGMVRRERGHIFNLGSIAGHEVYPGGNVYCATKFAVRALNRGMSLDLLGTPIRVTSIDPGLAQTEFSLVRHHGDAEKAAQPYKGLTPLTADDIAEAIVWCATRPAHVNVAEMILLPTAQRSTTAVHREG